MISDVLRPLGRWRVLLVVLPVLCAGLAVALDDGGERRWSSTATVLTAPTLTSRSGAQYVNDLQAVLRSDGVIAAVAEQTGATRRSVRADLDSSLLASGSSLLEVTYTSTDQALAEAVPAVAARLGLRSLINPQLAAAQAQLELAEDDNLRAVADRDAFTTSSGLSLPEQSYVSGLGEAAQLRTAAAAARSEGRAGAAALDARATEREQQVAALAPQVVRYRALQADVDRTFDVLNRVRADVVTAEAELAALDSPETIQAGPATPVSTDQRLVQRALGAALIGLLAALLVLGALLLLGRRGSASPDQAHVGGVQPPRQYAPREGQPRVDEPQVGEPAAR